MQGDSSREEVAGFLGGVVLADEDGAAVEAGEACGGFLLILGEGGTPGLAPLSDAVEVVVGDEAGPELGDIVVVEAEVAYADGAAGEAAEDDAFGVSPELLADARDVFEGVVDGGLGIAPPGDFVFEAVF